MEHTSTRARDTRQRKACTPRLRTPVTRVAVTALESRLSRVGVDPALPLPVPGLSLLCFEKVTFNVTGPSYTAASQAPTRGLTLREDSCALEDPVYTLEDQISSLRVRRRAVPPVAHTNCKGGFCKERPSLLRSGRARCPEWSLRRRSRRCRSWPAGRS